VKVKTMIDEDQAMRATQPRVLRTKGLLAEYNVAQRPDGEWFALGSVRSELLLPRHPAWVLVGTGATADAAVGGLLIELESAARKLQSV
jgi:hypothetical protein